MADYLTIGPDDPVADEQRRDRTRVLICGEPDAGKTTSLRTWDRPLHVIVAPGELGTASIPREKGVWRHQLPTPELGKARAWGAEWLRFGQIVTDIVAGKHGEVQTLAIDGVHKLFEFALAFVTQGLSASKENFEARHYVGAWNEFKKVLDLTNRSAVPYVVMTSWVKYAQEDPTDKSKDAPMELVPAFAGQARTKVLGEFAVRLYATDEGSGVGRKFIWFTQPTAKVRCAGVKMTPLEDAQKIPARVPQDWQALKPYLGL